jgi:hypothetical protein
MRGPHDHVITAAQMMNALPAKLGFITFTSSAHP